GGSGHAAVPGALAEPDRRRVPRRGAGQDPARVPPGRDGELPRDPVRPLLRERRRHAAVRDPARRVRALDRRRRPRGRAAAEAAARRQAFSADARPADEPGYAVAIDADGRPCEVMASNAGHCLWSGLVDERRAALVGKRRLADDMFSGWGIRTLSARERRYNPMSYHNGSVWPHDNALAAAGFRGYRLLEHVITVASALFDASHWFEHGRVPELFCGFARHLDHGPVAYPVACAPQAWAAGSTLQLLTALIGVDADAVHGRVTF